MKSGFFKLLTVSSLVAGGTFINLAPANAVQIVLQNGDGLSVDLASVDFLSGFFGPDVITGADFKNAPFVPWNTAADRAALGLDASYAAVTVASGNIIGGVTDFFSETTTRTFVRDLDLTAGNFIPTGPIDTTFDPEVNNSFDVLPAFNPFVVLDVADAETPDLAISLLSIDTTQTEPLSGITSATDAISVRGLARFDTIGPGGVPLSVGGTMSFEGTIFNRNGTGSSASLSFNVVDNVVDVPESSPISALVGFGLVGSAFALKRRVKIG